MYIMTFIANPVFPLTNFIERPKLNNGEPPQIVSPKPCSGQYCMRATVKRFDSDGELINYYHGYSPDITICEETEKLCDRRKKNDETCSSASLMFLKQTKECNGRIMETDKHGNNPKRVHV